MKPQFTLKFGEAGHVDPKTKRVAVTAKQFAESDMNGDSPCYIFSRDADEFGLDPWKMIESIDPHTSGDKFDLWPVCGNPKTVNGDFVVYMQRSAA
jgi:hypothetical protein